jgi:Flp pilus assembly pilin Flp
VGESSRSRSFQSARQIYEAACRGAAERNETAKVCSMMILLMRFAASKSGVTAIEYALVGGLIILAIFAVVGSIGARISTNFYGPLAAGFS